MGTVTLRNVWKRYGDVEAVKDLNLKCGEGEFLALLGPSGCGKSSTLRMIAGLEKITEGAIYIDGEKVNHLEPRQRDVAMAFEAYALYPHLTTYENIAFPLRVRGIKQSEVDRQVREISEMLSIDDVLDRYPRMLSGGQQQRISFARALVRPARVYLMDEPLSHLDAKQRGQLRSELKRLHRLKGLTIIFVTHDQIEAMAMADRIAVLDHGILQQVGTPQEVFGQPSNLFIADFVGEPPMNFIDVSVDIEDHSLLLIADGATFRYHDELLLRAGSILAGSKGILGIRPAHVEIYPEPTDEHVVPGKLVFFENLGDTAILTVQIGPNTVRVEVSPDADTKELGADVFLVFSPRRVHLFSAETGENVLYQEVS